MSHYTEIIAFLKSNQPFEAGLDLLKKTSPNRYLIARLQRIGDTPFNRAIIKQQLIDLANMMPAQPDPPRPAKPKTQAERSEKMPPGDSELPMEKGRRSLTEAEVAALPEPVRKVHEEKHRLYMEASRLHNVDLPMAGDDKQRAAIAEQIVTKMQRNAELWDMWHIFEKTGKLPPGFTNPPNNSTTPLPLLSEAELLKLRTTRRSNVASYRKILKTLKPEKKSYLTKKQKISEWLEELKEIETLLKKF